MMSAESAKTIRIVFVSDYGCRCHTQCGGWEARLVHPGGGVSNFGAFQTHTREQAAEKVREMSPGATIL